ncbi:MAG: hypothetical protein FWC26_08465 [Fibromonadales bacterium]|nr:hypothetical protein [Fibromonadales bacterium]
MKKVLAAAALCAVSAFAAWDKFPAIEDGKGEAKIGFAQWRQGDESDNGADFKIRYSPTKNFELISVWSGDAYGNPVLGMRFQIAPVFGFSFDFGVPIASTAASIKPGFQFSTPITEALVLGSSVDLTIYSKDPAFRDNYEFARGMDLAAGIELDVVFTPKSTIWLGFDMQTGITQSKYKGEEFGLKYSVHRPGGEKRGLLLEPSAGYLMSVGNLGLGTCVVFSFGEDSGNDPFTTTVALDASVKF